MNWSWYELRYRALSPLHIGYHTLATVQRTRPYVTGRAMWGAVTSRLAQILAEGGKPDYKKVDREVHQALLFTYLFPCLGLEAKPLIPWFPSGEKGCEPCFYSKGLGNIQETSMCAREFERRFIYVTGQTAVAQATQTALDGSLHETEFLAHQVLNSNGFITPVTFFGYLGVHANFPHVDVLLKAIRELTVGGERSYGCGRLRLASPDEPRRLEGHEKLFDWGAFDADSATVVWPTEVPVPAHVVICDGVPISGDIEPFLGRETAGEGPGKHISVMNPCWVPGSVISSKSPARPFTIGDHGIWKVSSTKGPGDGGICAE